MHASWNTMPSEPRHSNMWTNSHKATVHSSAHMSTFTQSWEVNNHLASVSLRCVIYTLRQKAETLAWHCTVCCSNQGLHLLFMDRSYQLLSTSTWTIVISWHRRRRPASQRFTLTQEKQGTLDSDFTGETGFFQVLKESSIELRNTVHQLKVQRFNFCDLFSKCAAFMLNLQLFPLVKVKRAANISQVTASGSTFSQAETVLLF